MSFKRSLRTVKGNFKRLRENAWSLFNCKKLGGMEMETTVNSTVKEPAAGDTAAVSAKSDPVPAGETTVQEEVKQGAGGKTYDQAYIDKLLADQEAARAAAVEEALMVAKMDEDSKVSYEHEKRSKELADREAKIAQRELKADALDILTKNDVPSGFVDMLVGGTSEETKTKVAAFKKEFDAAVQAQVEKRLAGTTPKGGNGTCTQSEEEVMAAEIDKYL